MTATRDAHTISEEVRDIHAAAYERPLAAPVTTDVDEATVTCRLRFDLSEADELLIARGLHDSVHDARMAFETTMSSALSAAVERAIGRRVIDHTSRTDLHARTTLETFTLAPDARPGHHPPAAT